MTAPKILDEASRYLLGIKDEFTLVDATETDRVNIKAGLYAAYTGGGKSTLMTVIVLNAKAKRLSKRKLKRVQQAGRLRTVLMGGYGQGHGSVVSAWADRTTMTALFGQKSMEST